MGDISIPFGDNPSEQATLLLAAAEDLGLDQSIVRTYEGGFVVPQEVNERAYPPPKKSSKKSKSEED